MKNEIKIMRPGNIPPVAGDLRCWWTQSMLEEPLRIEVESVGECLKLHEALAAYDRHVANKERRLPHSSYGGLEEFVDGVWLEWSSDNINDIQALAAMIAEGLAELPDEDYPDHE